MDIEKEMKEITVPKCPNCGYPLKLIPAGTTMKKDFLTGKPYPFKYTEFYACTNPNFTMPFPPTKSMECGNKYSPHQLTN